MSEKKCSVVGCLDDGEHLNVLKDKVTGQSYDLYLCDGHDAEFECYHYPKGGGN
jgi:hypothetical protein